ILERYEAGIELKGSEVKSVRAGKANISDAFARIENGEAFLYNADIQPYERASHEIPPAKRVRKLLLHRQEIDKLYGETNVAGRTCRCNSAFDVRRWAFDLFGMLRTRRFSFAGKAALITGGSRGLGLVIARQLCRSGANVALIARDADELARAKAELDRSGTE